MALLNPLKGTCIAVGNFDGVHKGHRRILMTASSVALEEGLLTEAVTFEINTKNRFGNPVPSLTDNADKEKLLLSVGADRVSFLPFDGALASLSGEEFLDFLIKEKNARHIVCGDNFRFAKNASCGITELDELCRKRGVGCTVVPTDGISSTRIRELISFGRMEDASALLGRDFCYKAPFVSGNHIGRTLGFPTLNQAPLPGFLLPPDGVYVTYCMAGKMKIPAVTNIGTRPTVTDSPERVAETNLLGIRSVPADLLPSLERVYYLVRLRGEKRFGSLAELRMQIETDCKIAQKYFI